MRRNIELGLMLLLLVIAAACSSEPKQTQPVISKTDSGTSTAPPARDAEQRDKALVRAINAVPGNTPVDIFAGDQKVFDAVAFKTVTPYKELASERLALVVKETGKDASQPLAENNESLGGGKHYTIMVMPDTNNRTALYIVNDNITPPPADKAQVRVIHASPDAGEVDIVDKNANKKLFSGVNFEGDTHYAAVDPMRTTLEVRQEGQEKAIVTVPNAIFEKGRFYTIVVTGHVNGMPKVQTMMIEDQLGTSPAAANSQPQS